MVPQCWLLCPNTSVNEVIVLFYLEVGLGEAAFCSITRQCIASVTVNFIGYLHPFLLTMYRRQFLREEFIFTL